MADYFAEIAYRGKVLREVAMTVAQRQRTHRQLADLAHDPCDQHHELVVSTLEQYESQLEINRVVLEQASSAGARRLVRREAEGLVQHARDFVDGMNLAVLHARHLRHLRDDPQGRGRTKELRDAAHLVLVRIIDQAKQTGRT